MRRAFTSDGRLLLEAAPLLALTRFALAIFSFQRLLHVFVRLSAAPSRGRCRAGVDLLERVEWAVRRASGVVPGAQHCLTKALVAKLLLARQGMPTNLRIGVAKDPAGRLTAHAWLESDGQAVFGVADTAVEGFSLLPRLGRA